MTARWGLKISIINQQSKTNYLSTAGDMKASEWKTYRTRFLVKAKQLNSSLSFIDSLGRQHSGRKGDYLVESADGVLRIAPRQIFEDIYVAIAGVGGVEALCLDEAARVRRKLPESESDRRASSFRLGLN